MSALAVTATSSALALEFAAACLGAERWIGQHDVGLGQPRAVRGERIAEHHVAIDAM